jgi:hypothetical protein
MDSNVRRWEVGTYDKSELNLTDYLLLNKVCNLDIKDPKFAVRDSTMIAK